jgi:hypothetical protein
MALGLMTIMGATQSPSRLVIIVGQPNDPQVIQQHAALDRDAAALRERDVVVQDMTSEAAQRKWPDLAGKSEVIFQVLLIGKDGGVKLRRATPVTASEITKLIDTMPMRRREMR